MRTNKKILAAAIFTTAVSISASASASFYIVDYHDAGVWNAYDSENEAYAMKYRSDQGKDGFWLVLTDGDNPKDDGSSHAILYGDVANDRITAYTYNGEDSNSSYENGTLLGTYEGVFSSGGTHPTYGYDLTMFSIDVSEINNALGPDFAGVEIGEKAGIWFHQSDESEFTYGDDGSIIDYSFGGQMWLDRGNDETRSRASFDCDAGTGTGIVGGFFNSCNSTQIAGVPNSGGGSVPAPSGLALLMVGLAGIGRKMRCKRT